MNRLFLTQMLNPSFFGDSTPDIDRYQYKVTKVVGSLSPGVHDCLTADEVNKYLDTDRWSVTIT